METILSLTAFALFILGITIIAFVVLDAFMRIPVKNRFIPDADVYFGRLAHACTKGIYSIRVFKYYGSKKKYAFGISPIVPKLPGKGDLNFSDLAVIFSGYGRYEVRVFRNKEHVITFDTEVQRKNKIPAEIATLSQD